MDGINIGKIYRTPFEPSGLVKVLAIEPFSPIYSDETVFVEFIEDHPHGYKKGSFGRYLYHELKDREAN